MSRGSRFLVVLLTVLSTVSAVAQQRPFCTTRTDAAYVARFDALLSAARLRAVAADTGQVLHIPVTFHIQQNGGADVVDPLRLDACIDATNAWYRGAGVEFSRCGPYLRFPAGGTPDIAGNTVNVAVHWQSEGCGSTVGSYVFVNAACARTLENIISHELGHVLGLAHTHGTSNTGGTDELVDGSNCANAGDRICDTPADPNLLGQMGDGCRYIGTVLDANGMSYAPLTHNIMSYTNSECADSLTPMQLARARAVALASSYSCCMLPPPEVRDTTVCFGTTVLLQAASPAAQLLWYDVPRGGTPVASGPLFAAPALDSARTWYVEAVDSCVSRRSPVTVHVLPPSGIHMGGVQPLDDLGGNGTQKPYGFCRVGDMLLFLLGEGVWASDGTTNGSRLQLSLPGGTQGYLTELVGLGDVALIGTTAPTREAYLYRLDPVTGDVTVLQTFPALTITSSFFLAAAENWAIFLRALSMNEIEIWRTDGTAAGTSLVKVLQVEATAGTFDFRALGDMFLFNANDREHGTELWCSDGTADGTRLLADIWPGPNSGNPSGFTEVDGLMYFLASDGEIGRELWVTDGTPGHARPVIDLNPGPSTSAIINLKAIGNRLYFGATDAGNNIEPWMADLGTEEFRMLGKIHPTASSFPFGFTELGEYVYCCANGGNSVELWRLDPRGSEPARKVRQINPQGSSAVSNLTAWDGLLFFTADDGEHGMETWRSDGTESGTAIAADIRSGEREGSSPFGFTEFRDLLLFAASPEADDWELYDVAALRFTSCGGRPTLLSVMPGEGIVRWYDREDDVLPIGEGRDWLTPAVDCSRVFWADVTVAGCSSPRTAVPVDVLAPPPVVRDTSVAPGSDVSVTAATTSGVAEWYADSLATRHLGDGPVLELQALQSDTLVFVRVREGRCTSPLRVLRITVGATGVSHDAVAEDIEVYPQPARDVLELRFAADSGVEELVLLDILGRELYRRHVAPGMLRLQLPLGNLAPGPYLLCLRGSDGQRTKRILHTR